MRSPTPTPSDASPPAALAARAFSSSLLIRRSPLTISPIAHRLRGRRSLAQYPARLERSESASADPARTCVVSCKPRPPAGRRIKGWGCPLRASRLASADTPIRPLPRPPFPARGKGPREAGVRFNGANFALAELSDEKRRRWQARFHSRAELAWLGRRTRSRRLRAGYPIRRGRRPQRAGSVKSP